MKHFFCLLFLVGLKITAQQITVEKIWKKYEYYPKGVEDFKSMKDGEHYSRIGEDGSILIYKLMDANDKGVVLVNKNSLVYNDSIIAYEDYEFNSDETKVLL